MGPGSVRPKQISHLPQLTSFRISLCSGCLGKERSDYSRYSDANCAWQKSLVTDAMTDVSVRTVTASKDANCGVSRQEQNRIHSRLACAAIGSVGTGLRKRWIGGSSFWSTPALLPSRSAVLSVMHIRGWMTESAMVPMRPGRCDRGSGTAQRTSGASFLPVQPPPGWFKRKGGSSGPELIMTSGQTVPVGRSLRKPVRKPRSANWQEPGRIPPGDAGLRCRRDLRARTDVP